MRVSNWLFNKIHGVKRIKTKGCLNVGITRSGTIVKYNQETLFTYLSKPVFFRRKKKDE